MEPKWGTYIMDCELKNAHKAIHLIVGSITLPIALRFFLQKLQVDGHDRVLSNYTWNIENGKIIFILASSNMKNTINVEPLSMFSLQFHGSRTTQALTMNRMIYTLSHRYDTHPSNTTFSLGDDR